MWHQDDVTPKMKDCSPRSSYPEVIVNYRQLAPIQLEMLAGGKSTTKPDGGSETNRTNITMAKKSLAQDSL
jgi:hypothetical protein